MKNNNHRPFHIYYGHTYFLTARCYKLCPYFKNDEYKKIFQKVLIEATNRFDIKLFAWILLNNHYHLILSPVNSEQISPLQTQSVTPFKQNKRSNKMNETNFVNSESKHNLIEFIRKLHKDTARKINKLNKSEGRQIWYQYWDYCIRNQSDFWRHFNYIIQQPLKHGLVSTLRESYNYKYSSNPVWLERFGEEGLSESFTKYPIKDWTPSESD